MQIAIESLNKEFDKLMPRLKKDARSTLLFLRQGDKSLDIVLIDDKVLKKSVWSIEHPKNFPHPDRKKCYLGKIYLNPDRAKNEKYNLSHLLIHGILHLLGYDHKKKNDIIKMEKKEKEIASYLANKSK